MYRKMLLGKIHRATVTDADLNYVGSISIDKNLMEAAGFLEDEAVWIYNINNGERFETYVIPAERGSGTVGLNGAAARCALVGDKVIIVSYCLLDENELKKHEPKIVIVGDNNNILKK